MILNQVGIRLLEMPCMHFTILSQRKGALRPPCPVGLILPCDSVAWQAAFIAVDGRVLE